MVVLNRLGSYSRPSGVIPFEMIDEDLRTARQRACRWEELNERRQSLVELVQQARQAAEAQADALGARDAETTAAEDGRLSALMVVLAAVERELAEVGPAREVYEELLAREERRLIESADPRGAELMEIGRLLAELAIELPARQRARAAGHEALRRRGDRDAEAAFIRKAEALGMMIDPTASTPGPVAPGPVAPRLDGCGSVDCGSVGLGSVDLRPDGGGSVDLEPDGRGLVDSGPVDPGSVDSRPVDSRPVGLGSNSRASGDHSADHHGSDHRGFSGVQVLVELLEERCVRSLGSCATSFVPVASSCSSADP